MTKGKTPTYTLAQVAKRAKIDPKAARAKFRRMTEERPFNHAKVRTLTAAQAKAATTFLKTDFRNV